MTRISTIVLIPLSLVLGNALLPGSATAQDFATDDPVLDRIWQAGMVDSRAEELAQILLDSLGPRLTGTPGSEAAADWVARTYRTWGIDARLEPYGSWTGWRRGITHVDLIEPRVRSLNAMTLAWSPGTSGPVSGDVIMLPRLAGPAALPGFLESARGRFVLLAPPEPTCRPEENWERWATSETLERLRNDRAALRTDWAERLSSTGLRLRELAARLDEGGVAGIFTSNWPNGWGVRRVFDAATRLNAPHIGLSCEDYGLLWRMAERGQGPIVRVEAEAALLGEVPVANLIGMIPGTERPDEYVMLSAHFDSWDGASGATDNGTGTITMMEAMRILQKVYPRPRRTILVGHWNGEEQGLNGSRAFAADYPEVVEGLQLLLNQDSGTGRVTTVSMMGLVDAGGFFGRWLARIPREITRHITLVAPGSPSGGGSDYASFICAGAPAIALSSLSWDYGSYTWHSSLDTFDKVVIDDLKNNATLAAMLAYLASEEPERIPRTRRLMPVDQRTGEPASWPTCRDAVRSFIR